MIAACYSMDLYCERADKDAPNYVRHLYGEFPHQFIGETRAEVTRAARRRGWRISWPHRTAVCPSCNRRKAAD